MKKRILNYRIYNPNPVDVTTDFLLKLLIEANLEKVEKAVKMTFEQLAEEGEYENSGILPGFYR